MPNATPLPHADPGRIGQYRLAGRLVSQAAESKRPADLPGPGTGVVYLARTSGNEPVTITLLDPLPASDSATRDRFMAEARVARRVAPFCAARILDAGFHGDFPYLVCEYISGPTLREAVESDGPRGSEALHATAIGAATGLAAIHQAGLVHGDFGPDHVVLGRDGPRILHAGISPPYGPFTPTGDVLAWARTVLFAASGQRRPGPSQPREVMALPEPVRQVIADCLDPEPAARPTAKIVVTRLLGHTSAPAGVLAEGSRIAAGLNSARGAGGPAPRSGAGEAAKGSAGQSTPSPQRSYRSWRGGAPWRTYTAGRGPAARGPAQAPGTQAPAPQSPSTQAPGTRDPGAQAPGTRDPGAQRPGTRDPGAQGPGAQGPATRDPGTLGPRPAEFRTPGSGPPGSGPPARAHEPPSPGPAAARPGSRGTAGAADAGPATPAGSAAGGASPAGPPASPRPAGSRSAGLRPAGHRAAGLRAAGPRPAGSGPAGRGPAGAGAAGPRRAGRPRGGASASGQDPAGDHYMRDEGVMGASAAAGLDEPIRGTRPRRAGMPPPRRRRTGLAWAAVTAGVAAVAAVAAVVYMQRSGSGPGPAPVRTRQADPRPSPSRSSPPGPSGSATPEIPSAFSGNWSGTVRQRGSLGLSFAVQMSLTGGGESGTVTYPSLGCSGPLTPLSASNDKLVVEQGVVSGQQTCGQGTITLTRGPDGSLSYSFAPKVAGGPRTTGTLAH